MRNKKRKQIIKVMIHGCEQRKPNNDKTDGSSNAIQIQKMPNNTKYNSKTWIQGCEQRNPNNDTAHTS